MSSKGALRWTPEQLANFERSKTDVMNRKPAPVPPAKVFGAGTLRDSGMNKTEAEYARQLEADKQAGLILWYVFEGVTLKLADNTRYTPDFVVMTHTGQIQVREVKGGFIREDGWMKLKIAAGMYPFKFFLCQKHGKAKGGQWETKEV